MRFCGQVNGLNLTTIAAGDSRPDSYMALFPNFAERSPAERHSRSVLWNDWTRSRINPSRRVMPGHYFMFLETPLAAVKSESRVFFRHAAGHAPEKDGCGCGFFQDAYNVAVGFR